MEKRWTDYCRVPSTGEEFECYVGTIFEDLGYKVSTTPVTGDYGADLLLEEQGTGKRIAVQAKFYNRQSLNGNPIQEVTASLSHHGAQEGWVVTNAAGFTANAQTLAEENDVTLIASDALYFLLKQAQAVVRSEDGAQMREELPFFGYVPAGPAAVSHREPVLPACLSVKPVKSS